MQQQQKWLPTLKEAPANGRCMLAKPPSASIGVTGLSLVPFMPGRHPAPALPPSSSMAPFFSRCRGGELPRLFMLPLNEKISCRRHASLHILPANISAPHPAFCPYVMLARSS